VALYLDANPRLKTISSEWNVYAEAFFPFLSTNKPEWLNKIFDALGQSAAFDFKDLLELFQSNGGAGRMITRCFGNII